MNQALRKKLFDRLMQGAVEETKGDKNALKALEESTHEDLDAIEPIIDELVAISKEKAEWLAIEVLNHIDTMYPSMWTAVPKSARTSIRNTILRKGR